MKKLTVIFIVIIPSLAIAQIPTIRNQTTSILTAFGYESITVATTAIGFTSATINPTVAGAPVSITRAQRADCSLETAQIRYRYDGTNPTASEGSLIEVGQSISVFGYTNISSFRAIRTGGTSGVLKCHYLRF